MRYFHGLMEGSNTAKVLELIKQKPRTCPEIADSISAPRNHVYNFLRRLGKTHLITTTGEGQNRVYTYIGDKSVMAIEKAKEDRIQRVLHLVQAVNEIDIAEVCRLLKVDETEMLEIIGLAIKTGKVKISGVLSAT